MQHEEGPPEYTEYPTKLPESFPIGPHKVQPLVNVTGLQAHLKLLGAIHKLKQNVQSQEDGIAARNKDQAWVVFVNRAVHRFYQWTTSPWSRHLPRLTEQVVPPLDVIMVWHSYLLNPRAYYEDSRRMETDYCINLQKMQSMPLRLISALIDTQTLESLPPSTERQTFFETTTGLPFACPLVTKFSDVVTLDCPFCLQKNFLVKWISDNERGFAQTKFRYPCESCGEYFTKANMGVRRFAGEVSRKRAGNKVYISETLLDPRTGRVDKVEADALTERIFKHLDEIAKINTPITEDKVQAEATSLAVKLNYDYETLSVKLHTSVRPNYATMSNRVPLPRIQRIAVAYSHDGPASLDLVGAILRQGAFIEKMVHIGWTQTKRFDYEHTLAPLVRSIARYHAFLDLMRAHPTTLLVPTLDIDLAWHSHQLKGGTYRKNTLAYINRTPNHDDSIESFVLAKGYDITAKAWKKRFGVPYSICGCILDRDTQSRISRLASKIAYIGKKDKEEEPVLVNTRPDLVTIEDDEADSSHPSEHPLLVDNPGSAMNSTRMDSRQKVSMKCVASAKKGASRDPWRALQAERSERRKNGRHREAFTDPYYGYGYYYPYWGVSTPYPPGFYGGYGYAGSGTGSAGCGTGCGAAGCGGGACSGGGCSGGGCGGGGCG